MAIQMSRREKYAVFICAGFICLFVFLQFILFPYFDERDRLTRAVQVKTKMLEDVQGLKSEYDAIQKSVDVSKLHMSRREEGFTLFSFLDKLAGQTGVKEHITYMKPSISGQKESPYKTSSVEMKLQAVSMEQLTAYLYMVETSKNMVRIKRISILKTGKDEGFIDVVMQVETLVI
ncbi:type II secretion system protein GspM [Thermodesulfobacteriota bacterium]